MIEEQTDKLEIIHIFKDENQDYIKIKEIINKKIILSIVELESKISDE